MSGAYQRGFQGSCLWYELQITKTNWELTASVTQGIESNWADYLWN
jgi:hypothetical protein